MSASKRIFRKLLVVLALLPLGLASAEPRPPPPAAQTATRMRGVTSAQRRAAAARTTARKVAAGQKNQVVQPHGQRRAR